MLTLKLDKPYDKIQTPNAHTNFSIFKMHNYGVIYIHWNGRRSGGLGQWPSIKKQVKSRWRNNFAKWIGEQNKKRLGQVARRNHCRELVAPNKQFLKFCGANNHLQKFYCFKFYLIFKLTMYPMFKLIVFELKFSFAIVCLHITWTFTLMGRNRVV